MATTTREVPPLAKLGVRPRLRDYVRALWDRREFAMAIPKAQIQAQHRDSVLGGLWHLLDPMMQVAVWWLIFGVILNLSRGVDNFVGFLVIGVFMFQFTTNAVRQGARALANNEGLMRSISFPRAILPLSTVISELLSLTYSFIAMYAIVLITGEEISWTWLLIFPIVALQLPFNAGLAMAMARVGERFRDVLQVLPYTLRIWGMMSGVFVPIQRRLREHPALLHIMVWNPAFLYMDMARMSILENEVPPGRYWLRIAAWGIGMLIVGFVFFVGREQEYGRG